MEINGQSLVGNSTTRHSNDPFFAMDRSKGQQIDPPFFAATDGDVLRAAALAQAASPECASSTNIDRANLLRTIASGIESLGEVLTRRACTETGLPEGRIVAETGRTTGQLRLFADCVAEGSWVDARIDLGDPNRLPQPRPDVRSMFRPLGPVAVFGPNNFPLAFSVAGGDTASALAAGNPVIVMAHYAHPGTSELVGKVIVESVKSTGFPEGTFSLLFGADHRVGAALVRADAVCAVAFTGSFRGGEALRKLVNGRNRPVPYFAEMSSINPVIILPGALAARPKEIASGLHGSLTLGVGQFCTNPGLVLIPEGLDGDAFIEALSTLAAATPAAPMLTADTEVAYASGVAKRSGHKDIQLVFQQEHPSGVAIFQASAKAFLADPGLSEELFGPATVIVRYRDASQLAHIVAALSGQLTATVHEADADQNDFDLVLRSLESRAGRIVYNAFPTGVEVCQAMVHGGPYPASSDARYSSVGTRSLYRFVRPVCYQDVPESLLPPELQDHNPLGISRMIDGSQDR